MLTLTTIGDWKLLESPHGQQGKTRNLFFPYSIIFEKLSFDQNLTCQTPIIWKWNFSRVKNYRTGQNNVTQNQACKTKMVHEIVVDKWVSVARKT
jgi:hypothetical protein